MQARIIHSALVATLLLAAPVMAAPLVTMSTVTEIMAGVDAVDFFYSSTAPDGEFLAYDLIFETTNGNHILDPERGSGITLQQDNVTDGARVDTWANTVWSSIGIGDASHIYTVYKPTPGIPAATALPTNQLTWTVHDGGTQTPDDNNLSDDLGDPGNPLLMAPYHIARILVHGASNATPAMGTARFEAYDNKTFETDGITAMATIFNFEFDFTGSQQEDLPEIEVRGNGMVILDGDNTPSTGDHTDFGINDIGDSAQRTYTIHNTGDADLTLGPLFLTGDPEFQLIGAFPTGPILAGGNAAFTIGLNTALAGAFNGNVSFENGDGDENPYSFDISGTVRAVIPEPSSMVLASMAVFGLVCFAVRMPVKV